MTEKAPKQEEQEPDHIRRARASLLRPEWQFSMRSLLIGTTAFAFLMLGFRLSPGWAVLDFVPMFGALLMVGALIGLLYWWTRMEEFLIGSATPVIGIGFLACFALWMREGLQEGQGVPKVNWEQVQASEFLWPYLAWLIVFGIVAGLGMAVGGIVVVARRWTKRTTGPVVTGLDVDDIRFARMRQTLRHAPRAFAIRLLYVLVPWSVFCIWLVSGSPNYEQIDFACWLAAIGTTLMLLVVLRQLTGDDWPAVSGGVLMLAFALATTFPIWRYQGGLPQAMVGYAILAQFDDVPPTMAQALVFTYVGWLLRCVGYASLGAAVAALLRRLPRRKRLALTPLPVEVPTATESKTPTNV